MPQPHAPRSASLDSAEMGRLVEDVIQRLERGEDLTAEQLAADYSHAASALQPMLPTLRGLVNLGRDSRHIRDPRHVRDTMTTFSRYPDRARDRYRKVCYIVNTAHRASHS